MGSNSRSPLPPPYPVVNKPGKYLVFGGTFGGQYAVPADSKVATIFRNEALYAFTVRQALMPRVWRLNERKK